MHSPERIEETKRRLDEESFQKRKWKAFPRQDNSSINKYYSIIYILLASTTNRSQITMVKWKREGRRGGGEKNYS